MENRIKEIAEEVCRRHKLALYDMSLKTAAKGLIVAIYITKIDGVTINQCTDVSRDIAEVLEEEDFIDGKYYLEVSSPGLIRPLEQKRHYVSAIGETVKITYADGEDNIRETGILKEVLLDAIKLEAGGEIKSINLKNIKKAKTYYDIREDLKKR